MEIPSLGICEAVWDVRKRFRKEVSKSFGLLEVENIRGRPEWMDNIAGFYLYEVGLKKHAYFLTPLV